MKLLQNFLTVGFWTLASRILGFVRDILFAAILGTGPLAEAFLVAFSLPNMFRRMFAEGAFNMAFIPMYSKKLKRGEDADAFASDALSLLSSLLLALVLVAQFAMPLLVLAMASGFRADDRLELAVLYGRIAFPYILFISLAALLSGILNTRGRFAAAAAAPTLLNLLFIASLTASHLMGWSAALALAWTVPVAGVAQLVLVIHAVRRLGVGITIRLPRLSKDMKRLGIIAAPAALAGGVVQINLLIGRQVASYFDGAVAWLSYADRLYQLPLGVIGIAIGVVLLPELSRKLSENDTEGERYAFNRSCETSLALALPATVALAVVPLPIVSVLFERGAFSATDSNLTALALSVYALGLPAFVLQKVYQPLYFAREDTRTPFRFAVIAMILNAAIAIGLMNYVGFVASAVGTTIAGWAMLALLVWKSRRMGKSSRLDQQLTKTLPRLLVANAAMGTVLWAISKYFDWWFHQPGTRYIALALLVAAGMLVYGCALLLLGTWNLKQIRKLVGLD